MLCFLPFKVNSAISAQHLLPLLSALQTLCPFSSESLAGTSLCFCAENCFRKSALVPQSCRCHLLVLKEGIILSFPPFSLLCSCVRSSWLPIQQRRGFLPSDPTPLPLQEEAAPVIPLVSSGLPLLCTILTVYLPATKCIVALVTVLAVILFHYEFQAGWCRAPCLQLAFEYMKNRPRTSYVLLC